MCFVTVTRDVSILAVKNVFRWFLIIRALVLVRGQSLGALDANSRPNSAGAEECPCIDTAISRLHNCQPSPVGNVTCYPEDYGSSVCARHDMGVDRSCDGLQGMPDYCSSPWCYVDPGKCKLSNETYYRTRLFEDQEPKLYFSFSTCGSSEGSITGMLGERFKATAPFEGKVVSVTLPRLLHPRHYKRENGKVADWRSEVYYDDSVAWEGWIVDYMNEVADVTAIKDFDFTFRSKGHDKLDSDPFESTVYDVAAGLSDMALSSFWITTERLEWVTYTVPVDIEVFELYGPKHGDGYHFENAVKIFLPFSPQLWGMLVASVFFVAFLVVLLTEEDGPNGKWKQKLKDREWHKADTLQKALIAAKVGFDSFLSAMMGLLRGAPDCDGSANFSIKILLLGFAFLALIAMNAYTANLAAFLTLSADTGYITMEQAVFDNVPICANRAIEDELKKTWKGANFVFNEHDDDHLGMLEDYNNKNCRLIAMAVNTLEASVDLMQGLCDMGLVSSGSRVFETPVAFPINKHFAAGMSYFMQDAQVLGVKYSEFREKSLPDPVCALSLDDLRAEELDSDTNQLTVANFALPFLVLLIAGFVAVSLDRYNKRSSHKETAAAVTNIIPNLESTTTKQAELGELRDSEMNPGSSGSLEKAGTHADDPTKSDLENLLSVLEQWQDAGGLKAMESLLECQLRMLQGPKAVPIRKPNSTTQQHGEVLKKQSYVDVEC